jgi:hypothetical protein
LAAALEAKDAVASLLSERAERERARADGYARRVAQLEAALQAAVGGGGGGGLDG